MKTPIAKKGPKAIWLFQDFVWDTINSIPNAAPIIKDDIKAITEYRGPKKRPIKKANLASPRPIAVP